MTKASLVCNKNNNIDLILEPIKGGISVSSLSINELVKASEFKHLKINENNIKNAIAELNDVLKDLTEKQAGRQIIYEILERVDASIHIKIDDDEMIATAEIISAQGGKHLSAKAILNEAQEVGVKKGFSKEHLIKLAQLAAKESPNNQINMQIASGKPAINGKDAFIKPLVESAQARILQPKKLDDGSVDMRDLGDIVCVKVGDSLARESPTFTQTISPRSLISTLPSSSFLGCKIRACALSTRGFMNASLPLIAGFPLAICMLI